MIQIYKGIFWYNPTKKKLIVKKVACNSNGEAIEHVEYSSQSGNNFNHKAEWSKLPKSVTNGQPYNYYPRGRVEIKNNKAKAIRFSTLEAICRELDCQPGDIIEFVKE